MNILRTSAAPAPTTPTSSSARDVTRRVAKKVGLGATLTAGVAMGAMVAPGLTMIPLAVVDLARNGAVMGMSAVQGTVAMAFMGVLSSEAFGTSQTLIGKATNLLSKDFWERALESPLAQKALKATDKLKKFSMPVELAAVSLTATAAASVAGQLAVSSSLPALSLSLPTAMATTAAGMVGMASLKKLREVRNEKLGSKDSSPAISSASRQGPVI